jgi:hypothetical protein
MQEMLQARVTVDLSTNVTPIYSPEHSRQVLLQACHLHVLGALIDQY